MKMLKTTRMKKSHRKEHLLQKAKNRLLNLKKAYEESSASKSAGKQKIRIAERKNKLKTNR